MCKNNLKLSSMNLCVIVTLTVAICPLAADEKPKPKRAQPIGGGQHGWLRKGKVDVIGVVPPSPDPGGGGVALGAVSLSFARSAQSNGTPHFVGVESDHDGPDKMGVRYTASGDDKDDAALNEMKFMYAVAAKAHTDVTVAKFPIIEFATVTALAGGQLIIDLPGQTRQIQEWKAASSSTASPYQLALPEIEAAPFGIGGAIPLGSLSFQSPGVYPDADGTGKYPDFEYRPQPSQPMHFRVSKNADYPEWYQWVAVRVNTSVDFGNMSKANAWAEVECHIGEPFGTSWEGNTQFPQGYQGKGLPARLNDRYVFGTP